MRKKGILRLILATLLLATLPITVRAGRPVAEMPPTNGGYSTVVYARLFGDSIDVTANTDYEVRALMDSETRAVGTMLALPDSSVILVFRIWGEVGTVGADETGQKITFLMHDSTSDRDYTVMPNEDITFRGDYTYGMPSAPVALHFSEGEYIAIEELRTAKDHIVVYTNEIDIRERLDALITRLPAKSRQTYHWELGRASVADMLTINNENGIIDANSVGTATVVAVADADASVRSAAIVVTVINPARTLTVSEESVIFYLDGQENLDVSEDMNGLIHFGPLDYSTIDVRYTSSDSTVVSTRRNDARGRQDFTVHKAGSAIITTSLTYLNCYTEMDTTVTADITVHVSLPLTGVSASVNSLQVCRDSVTMLTLKAQPDGAVLTADNINLTISDTHIARLGDYEVEDGASSVDVPIEGLFPGTTSVCNALQPDGQARDMATVDVVVPMQLAEGWQWVTCYVPTAVSGEALETAFGSRLTEVRSRNQTLFNDPDYGYIGSLYESGLGQNECYKILMAADASHVFERPEGELKPYAGGSVQFTNRWNWLANPYYCSHPIEDYLSGARSDDMIVSQDAYAVFINGHWEGSLHTLRYGEAYMYYAEYAYTTLKFKAEGYVSDNVDEDDNEDENEDEDEDEEDEVRAFQPIDSHRYRDNMCVIAALDSDYAYIGNCQIGAFVGDECRGTARRRGDRFFLTVHGDVGETVSLRLYDEDCDTYYDVEGSTELVPLVGSMKSPLLIRKGDNDRPELENCGLVQDDYYYTLQGIRLRQASRKGIYIHKGHKVAIK